MKFTALSVTQVAVEGNIGSGKSTFLKYFGVSQNVEVASEPVEMWKNVRGHNTLVSTVRGRTPSGETNLLGASGVRYHVPRANEG